MKKLLAGLVAMGILLVGCGGDTTTKKKEEKKTETKTETKMETKPKDGK